MQSSANPLVTRRIIWGAMLTSQLMINVVFVGVLGGTADPLTGPVLYALVAVATTMPLAGVFVRRALAAKSPAPSAQDVAALVGFALAEAGSIVAAVTYFLSQQWILWGPPAAVALIALLVQFPKQP